MTSIHPRPPVEDAVDAGEVWQPRGHPVRWAVAVVGTIAAVALVSIWFGALTPRLDTTPVGWGAEPGSADQVYLTFDLTNEAHAAVRLRSAGTSLRGLELVAAGRPVTLGSGETASITLRYRVTDCGQVPAEPAPIPLVLRTPLGLTRTVDGPDSLTQDQYGAPVPWTRDLLSHSC